MTNQIIVYINDEGGVSTVHPAPNCPLSVDEIGKKVVPTGKKYKIIDSSDLPTDQSSFRNAWTVDESDLTDGVGL